MQTVRIGATTLKPAGKEGILTPDAQGYYRCPVGAYNLINSTGYLYDEASGISMFDKNSQLIRQIEKGVLYGEWKHPERERWMTDAQYFLRIRKIDMDRVSHHIREYELVPSVDEQNRKYTLVVAHIKPYGPFGQYVEDAFKNGGQNLYFSVRSITLDDTVSRIKFTKELITHDCVGEGGILPANKYNSPSLEHKAVSLEDYSEMTLNPEILFAASDMLDQNPNFGLEDHAFNVEETISKLGWNRPRRGKPAFMEL